MLQLRQNLRLWPLLLSLSCLPIPSFASGPTKIFINTIPEYSLLSSCAEANIRTIIRDMSSGCGDDSQMTSYACFCFQSSAIFSSIISTAVSSSCTTAPAQVTSALQVFSSYCDLGAQELNATDSSTTSSAATTTIASTLSSAAVPASSTAAPTPPPTITATSPPSSSHNSSNHTAAIAAGVSVPVGVISLGLFVAFLLLRRRRLTQKNAAQPVEVAAEPPLGPPPGWTGMVRPESREMKESPLLPPQELGTDRELSELESPWERVELNSTNSTRQRRESPSREGEM